MSEITRILLVDDEKRILETFSLLLADLGYYVKTASTPEEALRLVSEDTFEIVFLDYFLGSVTGHDLMEQMSEIKPGLYYVIITAHGSNTLAEESLKRGASDFIAKPFFISDMVKSIDYVSKKREEEQKKKATIKTADKKPENIKNTHIEVLSSLARAIEKRDLGTYGHCKRVSRYCELIASSLRLTDEEKHLLNLAATLHDIGKIGISDLILGKTGRLTDDEFQSIKSHPAKGVEILKPLKYLRPVLPAIMHHHESYDGSGYPHGLASEEIPLFARIIAVADAYDAIVSPRPYRPASDHQKAISELVRCAGKQFDKNIVDAFTSIGASIIADQI